MHDTRTMTRVVGGKATSSDMETEALWKISPTSGTRWVSLAAGGAERDKPKMEWKTAVGSTKRRQGHMGRGREDGMKMCYRWRERDSRRKHSTDLLKRGQVLAAVSSSILFSVFTKSELYRTRVGKLLSPAKSTYTQCIVYTQYTHKVKYTRLLRSPWRLSLVHLPTKSQHKGHIGHITEGNKSVWLIMLEKINRIVFLRNTIEIQDNVVKYYYCGKKLFNYRTEL